MERVDDVTPSNIIQLFQTPYLEFSRMWGGKNKQLLDCACGNMYQTKMLQDRFGAVYSVDKQVEAGNKYHFSVDLENDNLSFADKNFDVAFSFETIEHLEKDKQAKFVRELMRVSKTVVIGSVSTNGPNYIGDDIIFKASTNTNPYHKHEFSSYDWVKFFDQFGGSQYFYSLIFDDLGYHIRPGIDHKNGISNYVAISS